MAKSGWATASVWARVVRPARCGLSQIGQVSQRAKTTIVKAAANEGGSRAARKATTTPATAAITAARTAAAVAQWRRVTYGSRSGRSQARPTPAKTAAATKSRSRSDCSAATNGGVMTTANATPPKNVPADAPAAEKHSSVIPAASTSGVRAWSRIDRFIATAVPQGLEKLCTGNQRQASRLGNAM